MKIIERKSAYPKRIICGKCTSVLEYDENDGVIQPQFDHVTADRIMICPVCLHKIRVTERYWGDDEHVPLKKL